jgi:hypothetical protein
MRKAHLFKLSINRRQGPGISSEIETGIDWFNRLTAQCRQGPGISSEIETARKDVQG